VSHPQDLHHLQGMQLTMRGRQALPLLAATHMLLVATSLCAPCLPSDQPAEVSGQLNVSINTARVWLTQMEKLGDLVAGATADADPPVDTTFNITRTHRWA